MTRARASSPLESGATSAGPFEWRLIGIRDGRKVHRREFLAEFRTLAVQRFLNMPTASLVGETGRRVESWSVSGSNR